MASASANTAFCLLRPFEASAFGSGAFFLTVRFLFIGCWPVSCISVWHQTATMSIPSVCEQRLHTRFFAFEASLPREWTAAPSLSIGLVDVALHSSVNLRSNFAAKSTCKACCTFPISPSKHIISACTPAVCWETCWTTSSKFTFTGRCCTCFEICFSNTSLKPTKCCVLNCRTCCTSSAVPAAIADNVSCMPAKLESWAWKPNTMSSSFATRCIIEPSAASCCCLLARNSSRS
mmetsp:Transcript_91943/g.231174  ORF Transcript_91943/g.231174 Transcript_91943/m.231174 type:complete len:234 (-) Transcript_91943:116-817(-)